MPSGNWYIDCASGVSTNGTRSPSAAATSSATSDINVTGNGTLRVNCDVANSTDPVPGRTRRRPSTVYIRNGGLNKAGNVSFIMHETFVYFANGTVNLAGNADVGLDSSQSDPLRSMIS